MNKVNKISWADIQTQYEILGKSPKEISENSGIPLKLIVARISENKWVQGQMAPEFDLPTGTVEEFCSSKSRYVKALVVTKQETMVARLAALELVLIGKLSNVASSIDPDDADAPKKMKECVLAYEKLVAANPLYTHTDKLASAEAQQQLATTQPTIQVSWKPREETKETKGQKAKTCSE